MEADEGGEVTPELRKRIAAIPDPYDPDDPDDEEGREADGWHKSSSEDRYVLAATQLQTLGMRDDDIVGLLSDLYWAAANCFGA